MKGWVRVENSYGSWLLMVGLDMGCRRPDKEWIRFIFFRSDWTLASRGGAQSRTSVIFGEDFCPKAVLTYPDLSPILTLAARDGWTSDLSHLSSEI
jgi:hypothetical protein